MDFWYWWIDETTRLWHDTRHLLMRNNGSTACYLPSSDPDQLSDQGYALAGTHLILYGPFLKLKGLEKRLPLSRSRAVARAVVAEKTPFDVDDVYVFQFYKTAEGTTYFLARKSELKPIFDEIHRQRRSLKSLLIQHKGFSYPIPHHELSGLHPAFRQKTWKQRIFQSVSLAAAMSFLFLYVQTDRSLVQADAALTEIVEEKRTELKVARKALQERQLLLRTNEAATSFKRDAISFIQLWEKLTRILPDDVWLTELAFTGDTVSVTGQARTSAASLIPILNASDSFLNPTLASAIVRVPGQAGERFEIAMKVKR